MHGWHVVVAAVFASVLTAQPPASPCGSDADFKTCINTLYTNICTEPAGASGETSRCSDDWRSQWMSLHEYCSAPAHVSESVCTEFAKHPAAVLVYHHGGGRPTWEALRIGNRTKFGLNRVPTVSVGGRDHLIVSVDRTNPLLYAVTADAATSEKIEQFTQLQSLAAALGGNLAQLAKGAAEHKLIHPQAGSLEGQLDAISAPVLVAAEEVNCILREALSQAQRATNFIQAIEAGASAEYPIDFATCGSGTLTSASTAKAVAALDSALPLLQQLDCADLAGLLAALNGDPAKPDDIREGLRTWHITARRCRFWTTAPQGAAATRLASLDHELEDVTKAKDADAMAVAIDDIRSTVDAIGRTSDALANTKDIKGLAELPKSVAALEDFRRLVLRSAIGPAVPCQGGIGTNCINSSQVVHYIVVDGVNGDEVAWDEIQTQPLKIATSGDFVANVHPMRPTDVSTSYRVQRSSARAWDMSVSLVRTRVVDPKFTAVTSEPTALADEPAKVIARTGESTRSGELALFGNVRPVALLAPDAPAWTQAVGLEIGSALSADKPAVFGGLSIQLGRYVRAGWGLTSQRVTELKGKKIGDTVASTDEIPTRQAFHNGHYVSLSISLGTISLFTAPKE